MNDKLFIPVYDHILEWARTLERVEYKRKGAIAYYNPEPLYIAMVYGLIQRTCTGYGICYKSQGTIAHELGLSCPVVNAAIRFLERDVLLFVYPRVGTSSLMTMDYCTAKELQRRMDIVRTGIKGDSRGLSRSDTGGGVKDFDRGCKRPLQGGVKDFDTTNINSTKITSNKNIKTTTTSSSDSIDKNSPEYKAGLKLAKSKGKENPDGWVFKGFENGWIWDYAEMKPWKERNYENDFWESEP